MKPMSSYIEESENRKRNSKKVMIISGIIVLICAVIYIIYMRNLMNERDEIRKNIDIPAFDGQPYVEINGNIPFFNYDERHRTDSFENYSDLDYFGRCVEAFANVSKELMPTKERGKIGNVKPTGWNQAKYEGLVESKPPYLYNRCHLIAYCLTGENDNEKNLITGTRYLNVNGMLPFEEKVAKYIDETGNHVLYRVTPMFEGSNLLASGVLIEAFSQEDKGEGICFCVYCFNVQPGVKIDYATGKNSREKITK